MREGPGTRFAFVVLHYLAYAETCHCIESVLALERCDDDFVGIIVVDNGSGDDSASRLRERYPDASGLEIIVNQENLGFARGNNRGYSCAVGHMHPDFVIVVNNDVMIEDPRFLLKVKEEYEREPFAVLGPDIYCPETHKHQSPAHVCVPTASVLRQQLREYERANRDFDAFYDRCRQKSQVTRRIRGKLGAVKRHLLQFARGSKADRPAAPPRHESAAYNVVLHGACLVFSPDFIARREKPFNPATFLYMEEDILAYECLRDGLVMRYEPSLAVRHDEDAATKLACKTKKEQMRLKYREKAKSMAVLLDIMREDAERVESRGELHGREHDAAKLEYVAHGYAANSVNGARFRQGPIDSFRDGEGLIHSFCAFYDAAGQLVVAHKVEFGAWLCRTLDYKADVSDAHNTSSLAIDGKGHVHIAWGQHNGTLRLAKSTMPLALEFTLVEEHALAGRASCTYPQFLRQPDGNLILLFRDGRAGSGALVIDRYDTAAKRWECDPKTIVEGGEKASPYWQSCVDARGCLHVSWTWRESSDASSNYDVCYVRSTDETCGAFVDEHGSKVRVPVQPGTLGPVWECPTGSGLMNQTSMVVDRRGLPIIATLSRVDSIMQYGLLSFDGQRWAFYDTGLRSDDFNVSGRGTLKMTCSRPLLLSLPGCDGGVLLVFREGGERPYAGVAVYEICGEGRVRHRGTVRLLDTDMGAWEPGCDVSAFVEREQLSLPVQYELHCPDNRMLLDVATPIYVLDISLTSLLEVLA